MKRLSVAIVFCIYAAFATFAASSPLPPPDNGQLPGGRAVQGPVGTYEQRLGRPDAVRSGASSGVGHRLSAADRTRAASVKSGRQLLPVLPVGMDLPMDPVLFETVRTLDCDWKKIYFFVRDVVNHVPSRGFMRGAARTLLDREGNSADQALLLTTLLRLSGYTAIIVYCTPSNSTGNGGAVAPLSGDPLGYDAVSWLGCEATGEAAWRALSAAGLDCIVWSDGYVSFEHYWVALETEDGWLDLDPSFKPQDVTAPRDVRSDMSYVRETFLGGLFTAASSDSVAGLSTNAVAERMTGLSIRLKEAWNASALSSSATGVLGGAVLKPQDPETDPWFFHLYCQNDYCCDLLAGSDSYVNSHRASLNILLESASVSLWTDETASHTIWLSSTNAFDSAWPASEVYIDNRRILVEPNEWIMPDAYVRVGMRVPPSHYRTADYSFARRADSVRVLVQGFGASRQNPWRDRVADAITGAARQGEASTVSRVARLQYLGESYRFMSALAQRTSAGPGGGSSRTPVYDIGLVGDTPAPWFDFKNTFTATGSGQTHLGVDTVLSSALEHSAIEMFSPTGRTAVSTVRLLTRAAADGTPVYLATCDNWGEAVMPRLVGYPSDELSRIASYVSAGLTVLLPQNGNLVERDWSGSAYVVFGTDAQNVFVSGMLIKGSMGGGFATENGLLDIVTVDAVQRQELCSSAATPRDVGADPVDMRTGAFLSRRRMLETPGPDPIPLTLLYNSRLRAHNTGFGDGWTCEELVAAECATDALSALGCRGRDDALATAAASAVIGDLLSEDSPETLVAAMAVADWWSRRLVRGSVQISSSDLALSFTRLPDGTFAPPPGVQATLAEEDGMFVLSSRTGRTLRFNAAGKLLSDLDRSGRGLGFAYSDDGHLSSITNGFGASVTISYEEGRSVSASDSAGCTSFFRYDEDGHLVAIVDPSGGVWSNAYDNVTGAISSQTNPDGAETVANIYNALGQVTNQTSASGGRWTFGNAGGRIAWDEDPLGGRRSRIYSDDGHILRRTERDGATNAFAYAANGLPVSRVYPGGRKEAFDYDSAGNLIRSVETDSESSLTRTASFVYDLHNCLVAVTNALGQVTSTEYDDCDRPVRMVRPDGSVREFAWTPEGLVLEEREVAPDAKVLRRTAYAYDTRGLLTSCTVRGAGLPAGGIVETRTYNQEGRLASVTDADGRTVSFAYDAAGRLVEETDPAGKKTRRTYTPSGRLASVTDPLGRTTAFSWTPAGNLAFVTLPDGTVKTNSYDVLDRLASSVDERGARTCYAYDAVGRIIAQTASSGTDAFGYDVSGNFVSVTNAAGETLKTQYDGLNRPVSTQDALGNVRQTGFDLLDRVTSTVDPRGKVRTKSYDTLGRSVCAVRPSGAAERFGYDGLGNLVAITNAEGHVYSMSYDALGRRISAIDATGHLVETNAYDGAGNLVSRTDGDGTAVAYAYDLCGRLVSRTAADGVDAFAYDEVGNLVVASNVVAVETFAYDLRDRLTNAVTRIGANTWEQAWSRDSGGLVTNVVYAPGKAVTHSYDAEGRLVAVSDWLGHEWTFDYDGVGKPTGGTSPDGTEHAFAYDAAGRLVGWNVGAIMGRTIERDAAGRRVCDTVTAGPMPASSVDRRAVNTFDAADRLVAASVTYAVTNAPLAEAYLYDGNGALTNATCGGEIVFSAEYDAQGCLVLLGKGEWGTGNGEPVHNSSAAAFAYDALGNRVVIGDRIFIPDHTDPLKRPQVECASDGTPIRYYIWGPGRLLGYIDAAGDLTVVHSDERGSVVALSDASGNLLYMANYGPHGEDWGATGENPTPFAWLGGFGVMDAGRVALRRDLSQGRSRSSRPPLSPLYLTRHRLYSATLNRFLSADPLGPAGGLNLYAYANGDPLSYIDPLGLCAEGPWYDRLSAWTLDKVNVAKDFYGEHLPWWAAGTVATGMDLVTGLAHFPSAVGHLGEGAGTFAGNPCWETAPGLCYDIATVATIGAFTSMALPSLNGSAAAGTGATIATKYGPARQSSSSAARSALIEAENGATVYRVGTLGVQHIEEGQFWALRNPLSTVGYAEEYGLPTASAGYRFVVGGTVKDSAVIITRSRHRCKCWRCHRSRDTHTWSANRLVSHAIT